MMVLPWRGEPPARLLYDLDGQWLLTTVELPTWQVIHLAWQLDNPDCEQNESPREQMDDSADRLREALQIWGDCL